MRKMHTEGVTLIELMVAIMVIAVIMAAGIPAMADFFANNRMSAAVNDVITTLHLARSEAVKRRANVTICASGDGENCAAGGNPGNGWIVFQDCSRGAPDDPAGCGVPNGRVDNDFDIVLQRHGPLDDEIADNLSWGDSEGNQIDFLLSYSPDGFPQDIDGDPCAEAAACLASLQFCDRRGGRRSFGDTAAGRRVQIPNTGRPRIFSDFDIVQNNQPPVAGWLNGCPDTA